MSTETITDISLDEKLQKVPEFPKKYKVIMLNDDHTPMDWVIGVLTQIFKHSNKQAEQITLTIHNEGSAVAGIYSYEVAESKAVEATNASRSQGFPLQIKLERE